MKLDPLDFFKKYELLNSSNNYNSSFEKSKICRYCNKNVNEVSFTQATHLLPELLGKNKIYTYDECNNCNSLFSKYETHLSIFIRPHISMLGVQGKTKIPAFHSRTIDRDENTRTTLTYDKENDNRNIVVRDVEDYVIDYENKTGHIVFRKQPFIPLLVYKSLVKIGLSLLPKEFDMYNKKVFEWLSNRRNDIDFITNGFITTIHKQKFNNPSASLYRAKTLSTESVEFPEYILILCFCKSNYSSIPSVF